MTTPQWPDSRYLPSEIPGNLEDPTPRRVPERLTSDPMHQERLLKIHVECYAGHRGEQTPRALILGDRRIDVAEVVDAWLAPE